MEGVLLCPLLAAQADEDHGRQLHAGVEGLFAGFDSQRACRAFLDVAQDFIVAAFDAHVHDAQAGFAQALQVFRRFAVQVGRRGVGPDAVNIGERSIAFFQNMDQIVRRQDEGVAVGEEDAAHEGVGLGGPLDNAVDFLEGTDAVFGIFVHRTERAHIMGTADSHPQDKAARFAGRPEYEAFCVINHHISKPSFLMYIIHNYTHISKIFK